MPFLFKCLNIQQISNLGEVDIQIIMDIYH